MNNPFRALVVASSLVMLPSLSHASPIVFTTVSADHMFNSSDGGYAILGTSVCCDIDTAVEFTLTTSVILGQFGVGIAYAEGTNAIDLTLRADSGDTPTGAIIESFSLTGLPPFAGLQQVAFATSVLHPLLLAGSSYWLVASAAAADGNLAWGFDDRFADHFLPVGQSVDGGEWSRFRAGAAIEVYEADPAAVPEPASMLLLGIGLAGLFAKHAHRRRSWRGSWRRRLTANH